jgi:hypothetical protein
MKTILALAFLLMAGPVYAVPPAQSAPKASASATVAPVVVKLSRSGNICHGVDSPWFARISNFKAFKSMDACLKIPGTREPKKRKKKGGSK